MFSLEKHMHTYTQIYDYSGGHVIDFHSDWNTSKNGKAPPVRDQLGNFEQTGKVRENHTKYWKTQGISDKVLFPIFSDQNCPLFAKTGINLQLKKQSIKKYWKGQVQIQ